VIGGWGPVFGNHFECVQAQELAASDGRVMVPALHTEDGFDARRARKGFCLFIQTRRPQLNAREMPTKGEALSVGLQKLHDADGQDRLSFPAVQRARRAWLDMRGRGLKAEG
jgi:hypothetical protein